MVLADGPDIVDFFLFHMLLPFLGALVVFGTLGAIGTWLQPRIARVWRRSAVRHWLISFSGGTISVLAGLIGNGIVNLFCLPLTRVPEGSGIKPMALPFMFVLIAAATGVIGGRALTNPDRPQGCEIIRIAGGVLCLTPLFAGCITMHWIAAARDLTFG